MSETPPTAGDTPAELAAAAEAAVEGSHAAVEPLKPAPAPESPDSVLVRVTGPFWASTYVAVGRLTIDRSGVLVPRDAVNGIVASAGLAGIELKVGKTQ